MGGRTESTVTTVSGIVPPVDYRQRLPRAVFMFENNLGLGDCLLAEECLHPDGAAQGFLYRNAEGLDDQREVFPSIVR